MPATPLKLLSDAVFGPVSRAYKVGGLGLALLSLGAFLMLAACLRDRSGLAYFLAGTGFLLIALTCALFFLRDVRPLFKAQRSIKQNRELIDTVQVAALHATEISSDLQALAFKHASSVSAALQLLRPQLRQVPFLGKLADNELLVRTDKLSVAIVDYTGRAKSVIKDIEGALVRADAEGLKKYLADLAAIRADVEQLLKQ